MNTAPTISKVHPAEKTLDYSRLKEEGLKYIEELGSDFWTDYNEHDPGITILELLCYAITDLGYRANMPVQDLLASKEQNQANLQNQFFTPKEMLTTEPVSELDLRKLLIDVDGVKNAWLFKSKQTLFFDKKESRIVGAEPLPNHAFTTFDLNGLYHIKIELDEEPIAKNCDDNTTLTEEEINERQETVNEIISRVRQRFHHHRPLCEDLMDVSIVEEQKIRFCMDIQLEANADANQVYPRVLYILSRYLSPAIRQYSLKEMIGARKANGVAYTMDEIFNGPVLDHGFFKDEELYNARLKETIYGSDIINLLMDIPGIRSIHHLRMNYCEEVAAEKNEWILPVSPGKKPVLCYCRSAINFYKDVIPVKAPRQQAIEKWVALLQEERATSLSVTYDDYQYSEGSWRNLDAYTSITKNLPQCYGVGDDGLSPSVPFSQTIKALQLKGFLLFFDQVLANYIAQINQLKYLFQIKQSHIDAIDTGTYFFKKISEVKEIELLIDGYVTMDEPGGMLAGLVSQYDNVSDRKNRLLDHLLSRFAENFTEYVLQMYSLEGQQSAEKLIKAKSLLLKDYPEISAKRGTAYDYFNSIDNKGNVVGIWDSKNVAGMEHRLSRLLGIENYNRRSLSDNSEEGMFIIEHILLRPDFQLLQEQEGLFEPKNFIAVCSGNDCDDCEADVYSFRITVILPAETELFKNEDFRNYIEKAIRLETPAHIYPRICWWDNEALAAFEPVYKNWLELKQAGGDATTEGLTVLQQLIQLLNERKSIYPPGVLSDCDNPVDNPVILDQTNLGNLKT